MSASKMDTVDFQSAWKRHPSANLSAEGDVKITFPENEKIKKFNNKEVEEIRKKKLEHLQSLSRNFLNSKKVTSKSYCIVGIMYAQNDFFNVATPSFFHKFYAA